MSFDESEAFLLVIFGATGDLSHRMVFPALHRLATKGLLSERAHLVGVGRRALTDEVFVESIRKTLRAETSNTSPSGSAWIEKRLHYLQLANPDQQHGQQLRHQIEELEKRVGLQGNRIFYLALPPEAFGPTVNAIGEAGLHESAGWTRIVVEKPFGRDLQSARELNNILHRYFNEPQIFRIDHFLGKETVQNLLVLRFANPIFETLWSRDRVESVQFTVAETLGVEGRAAYYETAGALRDMVQNHLTQMLCLIAMEVPGSFQPEAIRDEKVKLLRSVAPIQAGHAIFGQYEEGKVDSKKVSGYRQEPGVNSRSTTETFVALRLAVENWRWQGVPFYLRVGKRMPQRLSQIVVQFRRPPVKIFHPHEGCVLHSNSLTIILQPNEGLDLCFEVKEPGPEIRVRSQRLHFRYDEAFAPLPSAYETLLQDILRGEQTLFVRSDWVEQSWQLYDPVLQNPPVLQPYRAGCWGPDQSSKLLSPEHSPWLPQ